MCWKNVSHLKEYSVWSDPKINNLFFVSTRINIDNKIDKIVLNLIIRMHKYFKIEYVRSVVLEDIFFLVWMNQIHFQGKGSFNLL